MGIFKRILLFSLTTFPTFTFAAAGIGGVAGSLIEPVSIVSDFVATAAVIVGTACLFASFIKYMQHRVNELAVPISTVIVLFIIGVVLVLLPMTYKLTNGGIPYHYFR